MQNRVNRLSDGQTGEWVRRLDERNTESYELLTCSQRPTPFIRFVSFQFIFGVSVPLCVIAISGVLTCLHGEHLGWDSGAFDAA